MGKLILITGGARSGKSSFAEETARKIGENILYVATSIPIDQEMEARVQRHKEQRPSTWETVEAYKDLELYLHGRMDNKNAILLDCITIMVANLMLEKREDWDNATNIEIAETEELIKTEIEKLLELVKTISIPFIVVTNEAGMGVVPEYASGRAFRDIGGRMNQLLAKAADEVYICIAGIPLRLK